MPLLSGIPTVKRKITTSKQKCGRMDLILLTSDDRRESFYMSSSAEGTRNQTTINPRLLPAIDRHSFSLPNTRANIRPLEVHNDRSVKTASFHLEPGLLLHFFAADDGLNLKLIHARHKLLRVRDA